MYFIILMLIFNVNAIEPEISGKVIGVVLNVNPIINTLDISYFKNGFKKRIKPGKTLFVEWGNGSYYTNVISKQGDIVYVDYTPISVIVEAGATVKVVIP